MIVARALASKRPLASARGTTARCGPVPPPHCQRRAETTMPAGAAPRTAPGRVPRWALAVRRVARSRRRG